jgi:beta-glucanase (GH16 family)
MCMNVSAQTWQLVWADEFTNGIGPDWVFETGTGSGGWGNNELQYYRSQNATVSGGQLKITARREAFGGMQYTSARMKTQGRKSWRYGRVEARISMPSFQGVWPAFWMLGDNIGSVGWPACGEIDIMEHVNTGGTVNGTMHWQDQNGNYANYGGNTSTSITSFHTYAIEWNASEIKWFVDGAQYHVANIAGGINGTSEFHNNFFVILNMAIGGNWPGFTIDNNAFPATMSVDYVRV